MDIHCELILEQFKKDTPLLTELQEIVQKSLNDAINSAGLIITAIESRIKSEQSLEGKLQLKGQKYKSLYDITDLVGLRVVTFYTDDVDRMASIIEQLFDIDWDNSVDKRHIHSLNSFGYNSLHYVCRLPQTLFNDPEKPCLNQIPFELQIRTTLQHAWAAIFHDIGYKTNVEIPDKYMRQMNRLAGMLELIDDEFSRIRTEINDYRRRVQQLVQSGRLDDVLLDGETFQSYLKVQPFDSLTKRIAAINQAEIQAASFMPYLKVLKTIGCTTLGDVNRLVAKFEEDAYVLARHQLGNTDIDIIASTIGLQNICIVAILEKDGGKQGLKQFYDAIKVGGQAVLGRQIRQSTPWLTERHGYDPTYRIAEYLHSCHS